jgi:nicotinamidase/pyrazinamidase
MMNKALVIVDVQNDFADPNGSLYVKDGEHTATKITHFLESLNYLSHTEYSSMVYTQDWHIEPDAHFSKSPDYKDTWPPHCVANTWGAEIHPNLVLSPQVRGFRKGEFEAAYSGFEGVEEGGGDLHWYLQMREIDRVDIVGIAFDFCVAATAIDAVEAGYDTRVLTEMCVSVSNETQRNAAKRMLDAGVKLI